MADINRSINKLLQALSTKGYQYLYHKKQFMGVEGKVHNIYVLAQSYFDEDKGRYQSRDVYKTTSTIRMALYLRDLWFTANDLELPTDNEMWNQIREDIRKKAEDS